MSYTVKVAGCDASTVVVMDLDGGALAAVQQLAELVNANEKSCAPRITLTDVAEYTVTFDAGADTSRWEFQGARPDGYVSVYAFDRDQAETIVSEEIGWGETGWTLHAEGDMDRDAWPAGRLATWTDRY